MKKHITLSFFALLISSHLFAQRTEQMYDLMGRKTSEIGQAEYISAVVKRDSLWVRNDYFIRTKKLYMAGTYLDESTQQKHGQFTYYHGNGQVSSAGEYAEGKKTGNWLSFYPDGTMQDSAFYVNGNPFGVFKRWHSNGKPSEVSYYYRDGRGVTNTWFSSGAPSSKGSYAAGNKKTGNWIYYHINGKVSADLTYENNELVAYNYFNEAGEMEKNNQPTDRRAEYKGGIDAFRAMLMASVDPPKHWEIASTVRVSIEYLIDEEGNVVEPRIISPFHPDFDQPLLLMFQRSKKWLPQIEQNRRVASKHIFTLHFGGKR